MNCPGCGKINSIDARYCEDCGTAIPVFNSAESVIHKDKALRIPLIIGTIAIAVLIVAGSAVAIINKNSERSGTGDHNESQLLPFDPPSQEIRSENWTVVVGAGPRPYDDHIEAVYYSDFNGDGSEDALVLDRLSGSGRFLRLYVYSYRNGSLIRLFEQEDISKGEARLGQTEDSFITEYAIADGDEPNCCPRHLGINTYMWNSERNQFTVASEEVIPNPDARQ